MWNCPDYWKCIYLMVIVVEYSRQGKASKALASQMTRRASLARRLDIRCCSGRTIAIYLQRKEALRLIVLSRMVLINGYVLSKHSWLLPR